MITIGKDGGQANAKLNEASTRIFVSFSVSVRYQIKHLLVLQLAIAILIIGIWVFLAAINRGRDNATSIGRDLMNAGYNAGIISGDDVVSVELLKYLADYSSDELKKLTMLSELKILVL